MNFLLTALVIWLVALPLAFTLVLLVSVAYHRAGARTTSARRTAAPGSSARLR